MVLELFKINDCPITKYKNKTGSKIQLINYKISNKKQKTDAISIKINLKVREAVKVWTGADRGK